ncbi:MAG: hypothetical protein DDT25_00028 [Chloroflexi bacterium]|nr:hypothetical protein [Chloroflexota bacterium]
MLYPCAIKQYGFYEGIGHTTSLTGAKAILIQFCERFKQPEVSRKLIRLDGEMVEAFVFESDQ